MDWLYYSVFHAAEINTFPCQLRYSCYELLSELSLLKIIGSKLNAAILSLCHLQIIFFQLLLFYSDVSRKVLQSAQAKLLVFNKEGMSQSLMDKDSIGYFREETLGYRLPVASLRKL